MLSRRFTQRKATSRGRGVIDATGYPHIIDAILREIIHASESDHDLGRVLRLRRVSRAWRDRIDTIVFSGLGVNLYDNGGWVVYTKGFGMIRTYRDTPKERQEPDERGIWGKISRALGGRGSRTPDSPSLTTGSDFNNSSGMGTSTSPGATDGSPPAFIRAMRIAQVDGLSTSSDVLEFPWALELDAVQYKLPNRAVHQLRGRDGHSGAEHEHGAGDPVLYPVRAHTLVLTLGQIGSGLSLRHLHPCLPLPLGLKRIIVHFDMFPGLHAHTWPADPALLADIADIVYLFMGGGWEPTRGGSFNLAPVCTPIALAAATMPATARISVVRLPLELSERAGGGDAHAAFRARIVHELVSWSSGTAIGRQELPRPAHIRPFTRLEAEDIVDTRVKFVTWEAYTEPLSRAQLAYETQPLFKWYYATWPRPRANIRQ